MKNITLDNGYKCKINENILNDIRFLEIYSEALEGSTVDSIKVINALLGDEQKEKLYKKLEEKDKEGNVIVPADKVFEAIIDIIAAVNVDGEETGKN